MGYYLGVILKFLESFMDSIIVIFIVLVVFHFLNVQKINKLHKKVDNLMSELRSMGKEVYNDKDYEPDYDNIK